MVYMLRFVWRTRVLQLLQQLCKLTNRAIEAHTITCKVECLFLNTGKEKKQSEAMGGMCVLYVVCTEIRTILNV